MSLQEKGKRKLKTLGLSEIIDILRKLDSSFQIITGDILQSDQFMYDIWKNREKIEQVDRF